MVEQFLLKYFPPDKTAKYRAIITGFRTDDDESLHAAWERYKGLLRRCPHHGLNKWLQVQTFFDAQSSQNKQAIDQSSVEISTPNLPTKHSSWKDGANNQTPPGFDKRPFNQTHPAQPKPQNHHQGPSTSQHPNSGDTVEILLTRLLASTETLNKLTEERFQKNEAELKNQKASLQNIENQVGQLAQLLSERQPGGLPSNTVTNPNAQANAITLRSGKTTQDVVSPSQPVDDENEIPDKVHDRQVPASTAQVRDPVKPYVSPIPYPNRLKKEKMEAQYGKFLELFKQLHINLPFIEAISQMPKYAKFLKDVLTNKRNLEELSHVTLNEECSAVLQNKLPTKKTDPGSFTIPCLIGIYLSAMP
ncbi:uncharacterized protein LOC143564353 [Bidens hawaiensis]|uniref:uncharacterized protein LOC143564353 n=1 Tax=Bidens hawaiensis TaxID=980011 RepID=UPI00404AE3CA